MDNTLYSYFFSSISIKRSRKRRANHIFASNQSNAMGSFSALEFPVTETSKIAAAKCWKRKCNDVDVAVEKDCSVLQTDGHVNDPDTQFFFEKMRNTWTIHLVICTYIYSHIYKSKGSARSSVPCYHVCASVAHVENISPLDYSACSSCLFCLGCLWLFTAPAALWVLQRFLTV